MFCRTCATQCVTSSSAPAPEGDCTGRTARIARAPLLQTRCHASDQLGGRFSRAVDAREADLIAAARQVHAAAIERTLAVQGTARNWNTVTKLIALATVLES